MHTQNGEVANLTVYITVEHKLAMGNMIYRVQNPAEIFVEPAEVSMHLYQILGADFKG
jgi:hypothetical protein